MTFVLGCPACGDDRVFSQSRAFVYQEVHLRLENELVYDPYESEDIDFADEEEWFVCRACGEHSESVDHFKSKLEEAAW